MFADELVLFNKMAAKFWLHEALVHTAQGGRARQRAWELVGFLSITCCAIKTTMPEMNTMQYSWLGSWEEVKPEGFKVRTSLFLGFFSYKIFRSRVRFKFSHEPPNKTWTLTTSFWAEGTSRKLVVKVFFFLSFLFFLQHLLSHKARFHVLTALAVESSWKLEWGSIDSDKSC